MSFSLTARYVFPVDGPPLANGIVVTNGDKLVAVQEHRTRTAEFDLGNVAIIPGLVNAHTHLDLTGMRGKCPPSADFTQWLKNVIGFRVSRLPKDVLAEVRLGAKECSQFGTTLIGDIAAVGMSWMELQGHAALRSVVFYELIGVLAWQARNAADNGFRWLECLSQHKILPNPTFRPALSPHASYSSHRLLYRWATAIVDCFGIPLATHLAETTAELEFLAKRNGPFVQFLQELVPGNLDGLASSPEAVVRCCSMAQPLLLAHCNYLSPTVDLPPNSSIIYCPRTHAAFGHPPHPFRQFLQRGVRVALGTDSLASNPDLDMLAEMKFILERYPDFPGDALLRMGTLSGAEALGWADETGSLTPGKSADLAVVPLANEEGDPFHLLFTSPHRVSRTMFRGQWVTPADFIPSQP